MCKTNLYENKPCESNDLMRLPSFYMFTLNLFVSLFNRMSLEYINLFNIHENKVCATLLCKFKHMKKFFTLSNLA